MTEFYRSLHRRGQTTATLAAELEVGESTVRKLLSGHGSRGGATWRYLLALLTEREQELLRETEQFSTWNVRMRSKSAGLEAATT